MLTLEERVEQLELIVGSLSTSVQEISASVNVMSKAMLDMKELVKESLKVKKLPF